MDVPRYRALAAPHLVFRGHECRIEPMRRILWLSLLIALSCFPAFGQDIGLFLENLPPVGSWAEFRVTVQTGEGRPKEKVLRVAVTKSMTVDGVEYLLVEASPQKFLREKGGTLGLWLKAKASPEETANIFLRSRSVQYAPLNRDPYQLDDFVLGELKSASKGFKMDNVRKPAGSRTEEISGKKLAVSAEERDGMIDGSFGFSRLKVREKGTVLLCAEVPFGMAGADLVDEIYDSSGKIEKTKTIRIRLVSWGTSGAKSAFPEGSLKRKGIWGIIFS